MDQSDKQDNLSELIPEELELIEEEPKPKTENEQLQEEKEMPGLYSKAVSILNKTQTKSDSLDQLIVFDEKSGISKEDQIDIIKNINKIMESSRLTVTPEIFKIKASKRGIGFPLLVNVLALIFLAGASFLSWLFVGSQEAKLANPSAEVLSAGKEIIAELKRKADAELAHKNKEISEIQTNLEKINRDLNALQQNIEAEIASKEKSLREKLAQELEAERQKLVLAGASTQEVEKRMQELQRQQANQFEIELQRIKLEAEAYRQRKEQELISQKNLYDNQLAKAREEMHKLKNEYSALISSKEKELSEAETKIIQLKSQKERVDLINDQIYGFYRLVEQDLRQNNLTKAKKNLTDLSNYLNQPAIASIPEIGRRRDVEFFIIESISKIISQAEKSAEPVPITTSQEAKAILQIRDYILKADEAYLKGQKTLADEYYLKALEVLPEINKGHKYFISQFNEIEKYRRDQVAELLKTAEQQVRNKQYQEALKTFSKVLSYLPTNRNIEQVLNLIQTATLEASKKVLTAQEQRQLQNTLKTANDDLAKGDYDKAINGYLNIMLNYPGTPQVPEAAAKIQQALKLKNDKFEKEIAKYTDEINKYKQEIANLTKQLKEKDTLSADARNIAQKDALKIKELEKKIAKLNEEKKISEDAKLKAAEYQKLKIEYESYIKQEDKIIQRGSYNEIALGKSYLDAFLASKTTRSIFPELLERIKRYDRAFEAAGRESIIIELTDILTKTQNLKTKEERIAFLQNNAKNLPYTNPIKGFLNIIIELLKN